MKKSIFIFLFNFVILIGCNKVESNEKFTVYKKLGDQSIHLLEIKGDDRKYSFQSNLNIDINTLIDHGEFLTDKNKVYRKYEISDETLILELKDADRKSFSTFDLTIYAHDKNNVFDSRHGKIKTADIETFKPISINLNGWTEYGKDKYNYYFWNRIIIDTSFYNKF